MLSVFNFSIYSCDQDYSNTSGNSLTESQVFLYVWEHLIEEEVSRYEAWFFTQFYSEALVGCK